MRSGSGAVYSSIFVVRHLFVFLPLLFFLLEVSCFESHYEVLGVSKHASQDEIKKGFRAESLKYHPDKNPDDEQAIKRFLELVEAYETLSDSSKRAIYDQDLHTGRARARRGATSYSSSQEAPAGFSRPAGRGGDGTPMEKSFDFFLKTARAKFELHFRGEMKMKSAGDIQTDVVVRLEDILNDTKRNVTVFRTRTCPHCNGVGVNATTHLFSCPICHGTGHSFVRTQREVKHENARGKKERKGRKMKTDERRVDPAVQFLHSECEKCGGSGKTFNESHACSHCKGDKMVSEQYTHTIQVPRGVKSGEVVHLRGHGHSRPEEDYTNGDIIVRIIVADHPVFKRDNEHLHYTLHITLLEALLGFSKDIKLVDGNNLTISSDDVIAPGQTSLYEGYGLPCYDSREPDCFGHLIVTFDVQFPDMITAEEREALAGVLDEEELEKIEKMIAAKAAITQNQQLYTHHCSGVKEERLVRVVMERSIHPEDRSSEVAIGDIIPNVMRGHIMAVSSLYAPTTGLVTSIVGVCPEKCPHDIKVVFLERTPSHIPPTSADGWMVRARAIVVLHPQPGGGRVFSVRLDDSNAVLVHAGDLIGWVDPLSNGIPTIAFTAKANGDPSLHSKNIYFRASGVQSHNLLAKGIVFKMMREDMTEKLDELTPLISFTVEEGRCRGDADCRRSGSCVDGICRCTENGGLSCTTVSIGRPSRQSSSVRDADTSHFACDGVRMEVEWAGRDHGEDETDGREEKETHTRMPVAVTSSRPGLFEWWEVDLEQEVLIGAVRVTAGDEVTLDTSEVFVSALPFTQDSLPITSTQLQDAMRKERVWSGGEGLGHTHGSRSSTVVVGTIGRYVRVQSMRAGSALSLAEVEVLKM